MARQKLCVRIGEEETKSPNDDFAIKYICPRIVMVRLIIYSLFRETYLYVGCNVRMKIVFIRPRKRLIWAIIFSLRSSAALSLPTFPSPLLVMMLITFPFPSSHHHIIFSCFRHLKWTIVFLSIGFLIGRLVMSCVIIWLKSVWTTRTPQTDGVNLIIKLRSSTRAITALHCHRFYK